MKSKLKNKSGIKPKKFWNWIEATLVGLLALAGIDMLLGLGIGAGLGLLGQLGVNTGSFTNAIDGGSIPLQFGFFALSRALGLALVISFVRRRGISLNRFGFKRFAPLKSTGLVILSMFTLFAISGVVFYLAQRLWPNINLEQEQEVVFTAAANYPELVMGFVALVIIAPIVEEMIFRGLMLPAYSRQFGIIPAAFATSVLFGAVHWQLNVGIITFVMGLLLSWLYYTTRSLWPAIMFHSLKNLIAFVLIFNLPS